MVFLHIVIITVVLEKKYLFVTISSLYLYHVLCSRNISKCEKSSHYKKISLYYLHKNQENEKISNAREKWYTVFSMARHWKEFIFSSLLLLFFLSLLSSDGMIFLHLHIHMTESSLKAILSTKIEFHSICYCDLSSHRSFSLQTCVL